MILLSDSSIGFEIGSFLLISLLDDIQRLDLKSLKWEYVATLANPVAAW